VLLKAVLTNHHDLIADYTKLIEANPNDSDIYVKRGLAKLHRNDCNSAIIDFKKAIQLKLNFAEAYYYRSFAKGYTADLNGSLADLNKVLEIQPGNRLAQDELVKVKKLMAK
jgi:tetratricopeptide (TPR) repeat protein